MITKKGLTGNMMKPNCDNFDDARAYIHEYMEKYDSNIAAIALQMNIAPSTLYSFMNGRNPAERTLEYITVWVDNSIEEN